MGEPFPLFSFLWTNVIGPAANLWNVLRLKLPVSLLGHLMPLTILIADDNASVRNAMREVLEVNGSWEVIEAENGEQAVEKARKFKPRLVILDLVMPAKDGLTASREIAKLLPGTPVLMHTLYFSTQIQIEAAKSGVRKVVPKSEAAALVAAVRDVIEDDLDIASRKTATEHEDDRRRAEDRIRDLCLQITTTKDDSALEAMIVELRGSLHRHVERFRARLVEYPLIPERRDRNAVLKQSSPPEAEDTPDTSGKVIPIFDAAAEGPAEASKPKPPSSE